MQNAHGSAGQARTAANNPIGAAAVVLLSSIAWGGVSAAETGGATRMIKSYVGKSRTACETIDYRCPPGIEAFQDANGCGCLFPADQKNSTPEQSPVQRERKPL